MKSFILAMLVVFGLLFVALPTMASDNSPPVAVEKAVVTQFDVTEEISVNTGKDVPVLFVTQISYTEEIVKQERGYVSVPFVPLN
jgi:hypothetical protein